MRSVGFIFFSILLLVGSVKATEPSVSYASRIDTVSLMKYLRVLAADSLEGRETGKPGQWKAAEFIRLNFISDQLTPVGPDTLQYHSLSTRANGDANLYVRDEKYIFFHDFFYFSGNSDTVIDLDTIFYAGYGIAPYVPKAPTGSAVLLFEGEPVRSNGKSDLTRSRQLSEWSLSLTRKINEAAGSHPAILFIVTDNIRVTADSLLRLQRRHPDRVDGILKKGFPVVWISRAIAAEIFEHKKSRPASLEEGGYWTWCPLQLTLQFATDKMLGANIPFLVRGSEKPDEVVVVTAHYDHLGVRDSLIHPGADDDGSGTAAVLEMARVFSEAARDGFRPRRSILFMPVSGEEKGLLGSRFYSEFPLLPLKNTVADVNIDMIGRTDRIHDSLGIRKYLYVIGASRISAELGEINETVNKKYTGLEFDYKFDNDNDPNRYYYRSDHYNFAKHGIPCVFFFNGTHADYHKPTDTPDKIDPELLTLRTRHIFHLIWELANAEKKIRPDAKIRKR